MLEDKCNISTQEFNKQLGLVFQIDEQITKNKQLKDKYVEDVPSRVAHNVKHLKEQMKSV